MILRANAFAFVARENRCTLFRIMLWAPARKNGGLCEKTVRSLRKQYSPFDHPLDNEDVCLLRRIAEQTAGRPSPRKCLTVLRAVQLISVFSFPDSAEGGILGMGVGQSELRDDPESNDFQIRCAGGLSNCVGNRDLNWCRLSD
jgi:hypothetical protein